MPSAKIQAAALLGALASTVSAHGHLANIYVDGTHYTAYDPSFQYQNPAPEVIEWSCPECLDNGFVDPTMYTDVTKIACHKDATTGAKVASVKAGGKIDIQWTTWPDSHKGPVLDYLAKVDDATSVKSSGLNFFKLDGAGYDGTTWASDKLIANNQTWSLTIPSNLAAGQYVLRHEIIALHSAGQSDGAQNYPKCINIEVTGGGSESPSDTETADKFYTPTDPGILVNIYSGLTTYDIPGPDVPAGLTVSGSGSNSSSGANSSAAPVSSAASSAVVPSVAVSTSAITSTPAASSAAATSVSVAQNVKSSSAAIATPTVTEAPVPSSAVDPIVSQIASISQAIPSSLLTGILPTALPTGGAAFNFSGPLPEKPLPEGVTLKDLLEWLEYVMRNFFKGKGHRKHPRDF